MSRFDIPVTLFFFRRADTAVRVLERVAQVKPSKLYLICDDGRNEEERMEVIQCRKLVEESITWDCEVIKNYASGNRGVYESIGKGAKWVFSMEQKAIFLEDDNLPEISFFQFCKEMLDRYEHDMRVMWVCGTNYLENYQPQDGSSYVFTKHLMPCGWASWNYKFNELYDGELKLARDPLVMNRLKNEYEDKRLYKQQKYNICSTIEKLDKNRKQASWDFQMAFSVRINGVYGISPKVNLIENIGVDMRSTHGGNSYRKVMTRRFCGINSFQLEFPLSHPKVILEDRTYEKEVGKIILLPLPNRISIQIIRLIKPIFGVGKYESFQSVMKNRINMKR